MRADPSGDQNAHCTAPDDSALEAALQAQVHRVDRRVQAGGNAYANEREEVRLAVGRVHELRHALGLGRWGGSLTPQGNKPQFLLRFDRQRATPAAVGNGVAVEPDRPPRHDQQVVLKVYGRARPGEARVQRLWHRHGVRVVEVLASGDDPTSWLLMPHLALTRLAAPARPGSASPACLPASDRCTAGTAPAAVSMTATTTELADEMTHAHAAAATLLGPPAGDGAPLHRLGEAIAHHLGVAIAALERHGYRVRADWPDLVDRFCTSKAPTVLHGDLVDGNVLRDATDGGLRLLDTCAYIGPAEFDAARWAARQGREESSEQVLAAWLDAAPNLDKNRAKALLALELLMEAGVRELVKDEQKRPWAFPDPLTSALMAAADRLLGAVGTITPRSS